MLENIILELEWLWVKGYFNVILCDNNSYDVVVFFFGGGGGWVEVLVKGVLCLLNWFINLCVVELINFLFLINLRLVNRRWGFLM